MCIAVQEPKSKIKLRHQYTRIIDLNLTNSVYHIISPTSPLQKKKNKNSDYDMSTIKVI